MPRISELAWTVPVVHVVESDMLRALGSARELDKGKGKAKSQYI